MLSHDVGNDVIQLKVTKPIVKEGAFEALRDPKITRDEKFPRGKDFEEAPRKLSDMYWLDANPIATQHVVTLASEKLSELIIAQHKAEAEDLKERAENAAARLKQAKKHYFDQVKRFSEENEKVK